MKRREVEHCTRSVGSCEKKNSRNSNKFRWKCFSLSVRINIQDVNISINHQNKCLKKIFHRHIFAGYYQLHRQVKIGEHMTLCALWAIVSLNSMPDSRVLVSEEQRARANSIWKTNHTFDSCWVRVMMLLLWAVCSVKSWYNNQVIFRLNFVFWIWIWRCVEIPVVAPKVIESGYETLRGFRIGWW